MRVGYDMVIRIGPSAIEGSCRLDREAHFMSRSIDAAEGGIAYAVLGEAMEECVPDPSHETDVRAVFAAHMALERREGRVMDWLRLEQAFRSKEDERIWRSSIAEMRRAATADASLESVGERASLLAALVAVRLDAREVRDFDTEHGDHLDLSNHAMEMDARREETRSSKQRFDPQLVVVGNTRYLSDTDFGMITRMVSRDGMDQDLRRLALESARAMEKVKLGWGERRANDPRSTNVDDHTLAVAHREMKKKRGAVAAMAHQAGMGM